MFDVKIEGLEELERSWTGVFIPRLGIGVSLAVASALEAGVTTAKANVPVSQNPRGTHLRDVISGKIVSAEGGEGGWTVVAEIIAPKPYAKFVEEGTRPHDIRPKEGHGLIGPLNSGQSRRKKDDIGTHRIALRWMGSDGQYHFARVVHHRGTAPHRFMRPAFFAAERRLEQRLEVAIENAIAAMSG